MISSPTLSVITANYNHGHLISRAISAIVSQTRQPDEYIIVDDSSKDKSVEVIKRYAAEYPFITLISLEQNMGALWAIKHALDRATSDYIYAGAADDFVLPGFFLSAMDMAARYPNAGVIFGQMVSVDLQGNRLSIDGASKWSETLLLSPEKYFKEFVQAESATHSLSASTIYKRSALLEVGGFRPELGPWCDTFAIRAIGLKYGVCYLAQPCAAWSRIPNSLSDSYITDISSILTVAKRASVLMRSEQFKDRFPTGYALRWQREFQAAVIGWKIDAILHAFHNVRKQFLTCHEMGAPLSRWIGYLLDKILAVLGRAMAYRLRNSLEWYGRNIQPHARPNDIKAKE